MAIHLSAPRATELKPRIVVFGVGGAGGNAVNNMIDAGLEGVEFVVANTDAQQLAFSRTERRIQLGVNITQGLGAGAHPEVGMSAAQESEDEIAEHLDGAHMVFITAGMGGGTGTGAAPVIAKCARERGILTVGVVTKPFSFEGRHRMRLADHGITELTRYVDTLIVIPNQNLFRVANERTTFAEAFGMADQVLHSGVRSITDLMVLPGLINLDFADVRTVMSEMGKAMMGTGEATGEERALMAAQNAIQNPLLDETSLKGAKAVLVNVTGGLDMTLLEVDEAANAISAEVDPDANIIFGAAFDPTLEGKIRVSVVATGMDQLVDRKNDSKTLNPTVRAAAQPIRPAETRTSVFGTRQLEPAAAPVLDLTAPEAAPLAASAEIEPQRSDPFEPVKLEGVSASVGRIVDPLVDEEGDLQPDLYLETPVAAPATRSGLPETRSGQVEEPARKAGGWRSLFGGGRPRGYETGGGNFGRGGPTASAPTSQQLRQTTQSQPVPEPELETQDDLEIPSFLRRLAN